MRFCASAAVTGFAVILEKLPHTRDAAHTQLKMLDSFARFMIFIIYTSVLVLYQGLDDIDSIMDVKELKHRIFFPYH